MRIPRNPKQYELTNHLGNVLSTVLDRKTPITATGGSGSSTTITHYEGDVVVATDYYPFGSPMSWSTPDSSGGRMYSGAGYRYVFNNQEKEPELGDYYAFEYRNHDSRLGRFLSVDPLAADFPWNSSYVFSENRLIDSREFEGLECINIITGKPCGPVVMGPNHRLLSLLNNQGVNIKNEQDVIDWGEKHPTFPKPPVTTSNNLKREEKNNKNKVQNNNKNNVTKNINSWEMFDAVVGTVGGGLEVAVGMAGEALLPGLSTVVIVDGVVRISSNAIKIKTVYQGNFELNSALPSNLGGWTGKFLDYSLLNKKFNDQGTFQHTFSVTNDATTFVFLGGRNIPKIVSLKPFTESWNLEVSGLALYHYDNFKPLLISDNKK